jgi:hypothetical protein
MGKLPQSGPDISPGTGDQLLCGRARHAEESANFFGRALANCGQHQCHPLARRQQGNEGGDVSQCLHAFKDTVGSYIR